MVRRRYRLRFCKRGNLRFIGHRDLLRAMERLMRRARLPLALTQGFHPKPRVSYLSALPLGYSSDDEAMELILEEDWSTTELLERLNAASVDGLAFLRATALDDATPKQQPDAFEYEALLSESCLNELPEKIENFLQASSVLIEKANGKLVDARKPTLELRLDGATLRLALTAQTGPEAGVREILVALGLESELFRTIFPNRVRCRIVDERE